MIFRTTQAVKAVSDQDIIEVGSTGSLAIKHELVIRVCCREVTIKTSYGSAIEPDLTMPRCCLIVLQLDTVPGVRVEYIRIAIEIVAGAGTIPEEDVQPVPTRVIIDQLQVGIAGVLPHSDWSGAQARWKSEVEVGVGLRLGAVDQGSVD